MVNLSKLCRLSRRASQDKKVVLVSIMWSFLCFVLVQIWVRSLSLVLWFLHPSLALISCYTITQYCCRSLWIFAKYKLCQESKIDFILRSQKAFKERIPDMLLITDSYMQRMKVCQLILGNLQKYVSTDSSILWCKIWPAHFSVNFLVDCLPKFVSKHDNWQMWLQKSLEHYHSMRYLTAFW